MSQTDLEAVIGTLTAKLGDLDLDDVEWRVLIAALLPEDEEVEGFGSDRNPRDLFLKGFEDAVRGRMNSRSGLGELFRLG